jgi:thioesterase domain-containing protein
LNHEVVVALQPKGAAVPLFLVSPGPEALSIVRHLGSNRPVYGIRVPNLETYPPPHNLERIAEVCVRALRKARPEGPYGLTGWCAAGLLALEIAKQLEAEGALVAFVAMLDARTVFLPPMNRSKRLAVRCCHFLQRFRFFLSRVLEQGWRPVRVAVMSRLTHAVDVRQRAWRDLSPSHSDALTAAVTTYRPGPWSGRMIHIWAQKRPRGWFRDPQFICAHLSPAGFAFYEIPGDHFSMLAEPHIAELSNVFAAETERCSQTSGIPARQ